MIRILLITLALAGCNKDAPVPDPGLDIPPPLTGRCEVTAFDGATPTVLTCAWQGSEWTCIYRTCTRNSRAILPVPLEAPPTLPEGLPL